MSRGKRRKQRADSQTGDDDPGKNRDHRQTAAFFIAVGRSSSAAWRLRAHCEPVPRAERAPSHERESHRNMIRVPVPIDLGTALTCGASAFALATPVRVATLIELAIGRVLGHRAPPDKRDRALAAT